MTATLPESHSHRHGKQCSQQSCRDRGWSSEAGAGVGTLPSQAGSGLVPKGPHNLIPAAFTCDKHSFGHSRQNISLLCPSVCLAVDSCVRAHFSA